jgi:hypothetical protein
VRRRLLPLLLALALAGCATDQVEVVPVAEDTYLISTIGSKLALVVPKGGLVPSHRDDSGQDYPPHYFFLRDPARGLILSGWFERADDFPGIDEWWRSALASDAEKGLPPRLDARFSKDHRADVVEYRLALEGLSGTNSHLIAHWVEEGTWIELHASLTSSLPPAENQARLEDFFHSVTLKRST